jgi:hypothetical protein
MVLYRYISVSPRGEISGGIIVLLCLLLVLVLSESFDNFSVGKLISVSREAKKREKEVEKLEKQNQHLLSQIISISSSQSQTQTHMTISGDYVAAPKVQKASDEEVEDKTTAEAQEQPSTAEPTRPRLNMRKVQSLAVQKYLQSRSVDAANLIKDAKLVADPISNFQVIFDGYLNEGDREVFIEVSSYGYWGSMARDRLYVMLSKVNHYRNAKRIQAQLELIRVNLPDAEARPTRPGYLDESFAPAILEGLLKITTVEFSETEVESCRDID